MSSNYKQANDRHAYKKNHWRYFVVGFGDNKNSRLRWIFYMKNLRYVSAYQKLNNKKNPWNICDLRKCFYIFVCIVYIHQFGQKDIKSHAVLFSSPLWAALQIVCMCVAREKQILRLPFMPLASISSEPHNLESTTKRFRLI